MLKWWGGMHSMSVQISSHRAKRRGARGREVSPRMMDVWNGRRNVLGSKGEKVSGGGGSVGGGGDDVVG